MPPVLVEDAPADVASGRSRNTPAVFYHPELDVVRFGAFFLVFLGHMQLNPLPAILLRHPWMLEVWLAVHNAGLSGLCLFFALSSYLITELLLQEQTRTGSIHFGNFYLRRILRIWPLYFFFLLLVRPLVAHFIPAEHFSGSYVAAYLLMVGNWQCMLHGFPASFATPLWSISVEEQFYLVWPLTMSRLRRHIPTVALGLLVVANLARLATSAYWTGELGMWCDTLTRLDPFAFGMLMAYFLHGRTVALTSANRTLLMLLGTLLLLFIGRYGDHEGPRGLFFYPIESIGCMLLLFSAWRPAGSWQPKALGKVFIYLGRISYGLYVFHLLMIVLAGTMQLGQLAVYAVALPLTIAAASISYFALEKPFLRLKQRFTFVRSRL